jgi:hypothetical protein
VVTGVFEDDCDDPGEDCDCEEDWDEELFELVDLAA